MTYYQLNHIEAEQNGRQFPDNIFKCIFIHIIWDVFAYASPNV